MKKILCVLLMSVLSSFSFGQSLHSISGTVTGDVSEGVSMTLSGAGVSVATTAADGTYAFTGLPDGIYTVTPGLTGYIFDPSSENVTVDGTDVGNVDFISEKVEMSATISKLSFSSSYKETAKKVCEDGDCWYEIYSTDRFSMQVTIQFPPDFDPATIVEGSDFIFNFGIYSYSDTFGNGTSEDTVKTFKSKRDKGGSAKFTLKAYDMIKDKLVPSEKISLAWDKKKKLTIKITGIPPVGSGINILDLSGSDIGPVNGTVDTFYLVFGDFGAEFTAGQSVGYSGKKSAKYHSKAESDLVSWTAKGKL